LFLLTFHYLPIPFSFSQPSGIINRDLTFKTVFYRVYQNVAPPAIVLSGRRPETFEKRPLLPNSGVRLKF